MTSCTLARKLAAFLSGLHKIRMLHSFNHTHTPHFILNQPLNTHRFPYQTSKPLFKKIFFSPDLLHNLLHATSCFLPFHSHHANSSTNTLVSLASIIANPDFHFVFCIVTLVTSLHKFNTKCSSFSDSRQYPKPVLGIDISHRVRSIASRSSTPIASLVSLQAKGMEPITTSKC